MAGFLRISILMACVLLSGTIIAQPVSFEYLTAKDGLPQSTIRGIVKDKYGFMWFGTWNGLCRYDGYSFKVYKTVPGDTTSIASNRIHYLHKDRQGTIWVSVFNQIVCKYNYETDNFTRYKLTDLPASFRDSVNRQRDLIALQNSADFLRSVIGPFRLAGTRESIVFETPVGIQGGLSDNNVNCMYRDEAGILWIGTGNGGINKADLNAGKFQSVPVYADQQKGLYMAIRSMWVDKKGVWLGTEYGGLYYFDHQKQVQHKISDRLAGENIKAVLKDRNGNIWIGKRSGLDKYNPLTRQITSYFKTSVNPSESRFYAIAEDPVTHDLWFSYYNGILKYNPGSGIFEKQVLEAYSRSGAGCLFFDSQNNLWIGAEYSGLIQLKRDPQTNAWADTVVYTSVASDRRSPDERVYAVVEDSEGSIWVGAANGLTRINPQTRDVKTYTVKDGLVDHYITQVMAQPGYIWFAHKNGISKLNIRTGHIQNYAVKKPGQDYEFMDGAGFFDRLTGQMYYGTTKGFVHFNPKEIVDNPFLPVTAFTALQVLNKTVNVGDTINGRVILPTPLHIAPSITLTYEDKSFSIEFAALHYSNPARNQYAYMLVGQDKDWIYTDASRRIASYSNLSAGKYVMMVKASNSDGVWNPDPATLEIIVLPPWWKTWWAYTIYVLLLIAAGYGLFRIVQVRQQYHREILTERLKAEKAQELDQLKSSFFTNVSHEFRTPLTLIIDPLRSLLTNDNASEKEKLHYNVMYRNAQRLLTLINQFLDFRKLESGKMKLSPQRQDIVAFIKNTTAAFDYKAQEQDIFFSVKATPQSVVMGFDADVAGKVLYNLISNAFKFTPRGGTIEVRIIAENETPDEVVLSVTDNGSGIPADKIDKVFEPFFQVEGDAQHSGTGVGLSLTKELVDLHKGKITVTSRPGVATCFMVHLADLGAGSSISTGSQPAVFNDKPMPSVPMASTDKEPSGILPIVLIVEDNDDIRSYIRQGLSGSYSVLEAADGAEGFEKATASIPDLIVSDVMMPVMDGLELCKRLKTDEKTSHIPVILLTARQSDQYESESYETGVDAYVIKPFSMSLLLVRIRSLIEGRARLRQLFGQSPESYSNPVGLNTADKAFLAKATRLVEDNMSDGEVNVEWLAGRLFMSRTQLYRKIKAVTNQSVHEFVTGIRLHKAAGLLLEGQHSVTEIAFMVGYTDATSFNRMFQKQYGTTPKKYSQRN